jgi:predicted Zn-dependent peptidase
VFDQLIEHRGGMTNAATSHDYAHFYLTTAASDLPETLPYLAEILLQAAIPDAELDYEREVVCDEIRGSDDDPDWLGFQCLCEMLYPHHAYGRSVLGTHQDVQQFTAHQLRCFHRNHYQPENITVAMVGDIREAAAIAYVEEIFSDFPQRWDCPPRQSSPLTIPKIRQHRTLKIPQLGPSRLTLGWSGPGIDHLQENIGLDILAAVLAGSRCSRLVQHLREELGIVFEIHSCFSLQRDASLFTINAVLAPQQVEQVEAEICAAIHRLHTTPISHGELARAQRMLCHDYIFSTETPAQLAGLYGYYQTLARADVAIAYPQMVRQCQPADLQRLAQRYLSTEAYALVLLEAANSPP